MIKSLVLETLFKKKNSFALYLARSHEADDFALLLLSYVVDGFILWEHFKIGVAKKIMPTCLK